MCKKIYFLMGLLFPLASFATPIPFSEFELGTKKYAVTKLIEGRGIIWGMDFLDDQTMIFTEKEGKILKMNLKTRVVNPLNHLPASEVHGQGGLLDIAVHPDFAKNKWVYVTYAKSVNKKFITAVARAQLEKDTFTKWEEIFVGEPAGTRSEHFGSRLVFDKKGYIFFSVGERGERENAQKLTTHTGKILRLKEDGSIPDDNPFVKTPNAKKEIWSYGHRNPQGLFYDEATNTLYESEHGPQGGDELNIIKKGVNYGWPVITYGKEYGSGTDIGEGTSKKGIEAPIKQFTPSIGPCGLTVYQGTKLPDFKDYFISGSLPLTHLNLVKRSALDCETRVIDQKEERIRDVVTGPDELIYISTDSGKIMRIEATGAAKSPDKSACPKPKAL